MDEHYPRIIRQWLGEERDRGHEYLDQTTKEAADVCGRSQATSDAAKGAEPFNRKERASYNAAVRSLEEESLKNWAVQVGFWHDEIDFVAHYRDKKIGQGAEQEVYLKENSNTVIKVNAGSYHGNWLEFFNRILFHEILFPATRYTTAGFTEVAGSFAVIIEQKFVQLVEGAARHQVEDT